MPAAKRERERVARPTVREREAAGLTSLRRAYEDGASIASLARSLGLSTSAVRRRLHKAGAKVVRRGPLFGHERDIRILRLAGLTLDDIAREYGVSRQAVFLCLERART